MTKIPEKPQVNMPPEPFCGMTYREADREMRYARQTIRGLSSWGDRVREMVTNRDTYIETLQARIEGQSRVIEGEKAAYKKLAARRQADLNACASRTAEFYAAGIKDLEREKEILAQKLKQAREHAFALAQAAMNPPIKVYVSPGDRSLWRDEALLGRQKLNDISKILKEWTEC